MPWSSVGNIRGPEGPSFISKAYKVSDQTMNAASATDIAFMSWPLVAGGAYLFYAAVAVGAVTGTSPTLTLSFTGPASPQRVHLRRQQMTSATAMAWSVLTTFGAFVAGALVANTLHVVEGIVICGVTPGTMQMRAAIGGTASPSAVVLKGSGGTLTNIV